ncbi:MAG: MBL fold metallo-hydrolase [Opitutaceae bacterium]|nr:MBL fold metallo-hydrolase [Opitutaceae bacterium]
MQLHILPAGPISTNAYLLTNPPGGEAILIDAPEGIWKQVQPILSGQNLALRELWLTHGHWDHTQGGAEVVRETGARVRAHPDDRELIENPEVMRRFMGQSFRIEPIRVDAWVKDGEALHALGVTAEVRHVPGHCPGNVLFYFPDYKSAFVGDALFAGSVGRTDLPGGSSSVLRNSIRTRIYSLPDDTAIHPGHGPATTVADEKSSNPFVRA